MIYEEKFNNLNTYSKYIEQIKMKIIELASTDVNNTILALLLIGLIVFLITFNTYTS